eukprot:gene2521-3227_t
MTSNRPILYHAPRTTSSVVLWLINEIEETGLKNYFIIKTINLQNGENKKKDYLKINPHGTVPTFISEEGVILTEFSSIIMLLSSKYTQYHTLHPTSLEKFYQWIVYSNSFHENIMKIIRELIFNNNDNVSVTEENIEKLRIRLAFIEKSLGDFDFLSDDKFTSIDIAIGFNLFWVHQIGELKNFEKLTNYFEKLKSRKSFILTFKKETIIE